MAETLMAHKPANRWCDNPSDKWQSAVTRVVRTRLPLTDGLFSISPSKPLLVFEEPFGRRNLGEHWMQDEHWGHYVDYSGQICM